MPFPVKDYFIDSEDDIPEEYRKKLEQPSVTLEKTPSCKIIPGKKGTTITKRSDILDIFRDQQLAYLGHGTSGDENILDSILETGLKTKTPKSIRAYSNTLRGLDSTTIPLGPGESSLFEQNEKLLENWPHKNSKNIIIISLPLRYILSRSTKIGTDLYQAFCIGNEEQGYFLRPEFIRGIYNSDTHSFIENINFFQNLPPEHQQALFEDIKEKFIMSYATSAVLPPANDPRTTLSGTDLEKATLEWYRIQLQKLKEHQTRQTTYTEEFEGTLDDDWLELCSTTTTTGFNEMSQNIKKTKKENTIEQEIKDKRMGC